MVPTFPLTNLVAAGCSEQFESYTALLSSWISFFCFHGTKDVDLQVLSFKKSSTLSAIQSGNLH